MQIKYLHKNIYKLYAYSRTQECLDVYRNKYQGQVCLWEKLGSEGVSLKLKQEITRISRATYYRHKKMLRLLSNGILPPSKKPRRLNKPNWGEAQIQLVLQIRRQNPTYGKAKIAVILKRDCGVNLSESTVGRILKSLMNKGLIAKSLSAPRMKRKRLFKGHAKRWNYHMKANKPGEMVQIDHLSASKNGISVKHFQAWDPTSKYIYANVYSNAKSRSSKRFLIEFINQSPFSITSIQVDGGSEFMAEFEEACKDLNIALFVLPPSRPQYNGGVERGNRTFREEFYSNRNVLADSLGELRHELSKAVTKYNTYRPHFSLKGLTPAAYIQNTILKAAA